MPDDDFAAREIPRWGREPDGRFSADRLAYQIWIVGKDWAEKEAAYDLLEATRKPLLAKLTNDIRATDNTRKITRREAQDAAEGCDEYLDHIRETINAKKAAIMAKVKLESIRTFASMFQTEEATRRVELQNLQGGRR